MRAYQPSSDRAWSFDQRKPAKRARAKAPAERSPHTTSPAATTEVLAGPCLFGIHHACPGTWRLVLLVEETGQVGAARCSCWCHAETEANQQ
jgi:hypothetical protein